MRFKIIQLSAAAACAALFVAATPAGAATVVTPNSNALSLANAIAGPGVTVLSASLAGRPTQFGTFTSGAGGVGFSSGVVISTGALTEIPGPNQGDADANVGFDDDDGVRTGDSRLDAIAGTTDNSWDRASLKFRFSVAQATTVVFQFIFGSDEYKEFVDKGFNDVFAFFLDGGANRAVIDVNGVATPISIDSINDVRNAAFYRDNPSASGNVDVTFDGLTTALTITLANIAAGEHEFEFLIGDIGDAIYDSAIFISGRSFVDQTVAAGVVPIPGAIPLLLTGLAAMGLAGRRKTKAA